MEQTYAILTDSAADLSADLVERLNLVVLPLSVTLEGKEYLNYPDERDITAKYLYERLRAGAMATTAALNVDTFEREMETYLKAGKDVLYLSFSSGLSATYNASCIAAEELREKYPERQLVVIDSLSTRSAPPPVRACCAA